MYDFVIVRSSAFLFRELSIYRQVDKWYNKKTAAPGDSLKEEHRKPKGVLEFVKKRTGSDVIE